MTDERPRPTTPSPFGPQATPQDRWVTWAIRGMAAAAVVLLAYIGWNYYQDWQRSSVDSPSARAVANLRNAVGAKPKEPILRVRYAQALLANGDKAEAIRQLEEALKIEPEYPDALSALGLIAMDSREWRKAETYWLKTIEVLKRSEMAGKDQRLADALYDMGTTLVELKRYEEAVGYLKESLRIRRDSSPVHYMLSVAYGKLGLITQQKQELGVVLAFDPNMAQANYDLGIILLREKDVAAAAELFRIAADRAPDEITLPQDELDRLGEAATHLAAAKRAESSDPKAALASARIAAALDPASLDAVRLTARLWERTGDAKRAMNAWERVGELAPGDKEAADAIKRLSANAK